MTRRVLVAVVWALSALYPVRAEADLVSFNFTGSVTITDPALVAAFPAMSTVSGSATVDRSIPDSNPGNVNLGIYPGAVTALTITNGTLIWTLGSSDSVSVSPGNIAIFAAIVGPSIGVFQPTDAVFNLGIPFGSDSIPNTLSVLSGSLFLSFVNPATQQAPSVGVPVTTASVPEASSWILLGIGLFMMGFIGRKSPQKTTSNLF